MYQDILNIWSNLIGLTVFGVVLIIITAPTTTECTGATKNVQDMVIKAHVGMEIVNFVSKDSKMTPNGRELCKGVCLRYAHPNPISTVEHKNPNTSVSTKDLFSENFKTSYTNEKGIEGFVINAVISGVNTICKNASSEFTVHANLHNKEFHNHTKQQCPDILLNHNIYTKPIAVDIKTPMSYNGVLQNWPSKIFIITGPTEYFIIKKMQSRLHTLAFSKSSDLIEIIEKEMLKFQLDLLLNNKSTIDNIPKMLNYLNDSIFLSGNKRLPPLYIKMDDLVVANIYKPEFGIKHQLLEQALQNHINDLSKNENCSLFAEKGSLIQKIMQSMLLKDNCQVIYNNLPLFKTPSDAILNILNQINL